MRDQEERAQREAEDEERRRQEAERRRERAEAARRQKEENKKGQGDQKASPRKGETDLSFRGGDPLDHNEGDIDLEPFLKPLLS